VPLLGGAKSSESGNVSSSSEESAYSTSLRLGFGGVLQYWAFWESPAANANPLVGLEFGMLANFGIAGDNQKEVRTYQRRDARAALR
jgi:hypothetical protein